MQCIKNFVKHWMHSTGLTKFVQFYEIVIVDLCICSRCLIWITITILTGLTFGRYHIYCPHKTHLALVFDSGQYESSLGNICCISLKASPYYINISHGFAEIVNMAIGLTAVVTYMHASSLSLP